MNIDEKWVLFIDENTWNETNRDISVKGAITIGYPDSEKEKIFGDLSNEEISLILDKILEEIKIENLENKDIIIERVFKESGLSDPLFNFENIPRTFLQYLFYTPNALNICIYVLIAGIIFLIDYFKKTKK